MKTYVLQHVPFENPGILDSLDSKIVKLFKKNHQLPDASEVDFLIILGGPMNVYDNIEWLDKEKLLINELIKQKKPLLGICLGAQLIADALGAKVYPNSKGKEVGFYKIQKQTSCYKFLPEELDVLHWHGDTFTLPDNAARLYSTNFCENQAFIYNDNIIGLQFHMETTSGTLKDIVEADKNYIINNVLNNTETDIVNYHIPEENKSVLMDMINYITGGIVNGR